MIDCSDVKFTYDGERLVLKGVSVRINPGEFVCILGGNGSGKSTLAKHMNALLLPDEGSVTVDGLDTTNEQAVYAIRSTAGMVFQNPDDQLVASLVEDDVAFGPENLSVETEEIAARVREALSEVGLVGFERHETHALSGGQKQRVAIAGVLAMQPKILILDEASSMLDPRGRKGLLRVCRELNKRGMTIVMITHFMEEAAEADRVIALDGGTIALQGTPDDVLVRTDVLSRLNLEVPFACSLSMALQQRGVAVRATVHENALADDIMHLRKALPAPRDAAAHAACEAPAALSRACASDAAPTCAAGAAPQDTAVPSEQLGASPANACDAAAHHSSAPEPLIEFDHVSYSYLDASKKKSKKPSAQEKRAKWGNDPDAVWALRDVSLCVRKGEFLGLAGHTGSGKSTLIQHMNGLLNPTEGTVRVEGADIADKRAAAHARSKVGVVFQYPEHQLFAATVYDDVAFGPRNLGLSSEDVDARVREALESVDLDFDALRDMSPFELSGGQQRRVAFAGVLAMRPEVLVLDEPVAGLDPAARREFLELVRSLHDGGITVVMVSHSMDDLADYCDRVAVLKEGALFASGTPSEVFLRAEDLNAIGLGIPAPQRMALALIEKGLPLRRDVLYTRDTLASHIAACTSTASEA